MKSLFALFLMIPTVTALPYPVSEKDSIRRQVDLCSNTCKHNNGHDYVDKELKAGNLLCGMADGEYFATDSCSLQCLELDEHEDQDECFCALCKKPLMYLSFCLKPGGAPLERVGCDNLVCTGQAKLFGPFCVPSTPSQGSQKSDSSSKRKSTRPAESS